MKYFTEVPPEDGFDKAKSAKLGGCRPKLLKQLCKTDLLTLDDFGTASNGLGRLAAQLLGLLEQRYAANQLLSVTRYQ